MVNYKKNLKILALSGLLTLPICQVAWATPSGLGTFTLTGGGTSITANSASGRYTTPTGQTGSYTIALNIADYNGYNGNPTFTVGTNGISIKNPVNKTAITGNNDKFSYTINLTPDNLNYAYNVKIAQDSTGGGGNSEIAKQTLNYISADNVVASGAKVENNPSTPMFYNAMGDYFMGKINSTTATTANYTSPVATSIPQLRIDDSSTTPLYFYRFTDLTKPTTSNTITLTGGQASIGTNKGFSTLPTNPTPTNLIMSTSPYASKFGVLSGTIPNGGSYVSYGVLNADSNYVVSVDNVKSVTLKYEAIMKGNSGSSIGGSNEGPVGETENEWISFGIASVPITTTLTVQKDFPNGKVTSTDDFDFKAVNSATPTTTIGQGTTKSATPINGVYTPINAVILTEPNIPTATYNLTETVTSGSTANFTNYTTSYNCTDDVGTTYTTTALASPNKGIGITGIKIGANVTCRFSNTANLYVFSGTVFNDYKSTNTTTNYDGVFNGGETGIAGATVSFTDCKATPTTLGTTTTGTDGTYTLSLSPTKLSGVTNVCIVETNATGYSNDTTKNTLNIPVIASTYAYPNNNFGDVQTSLLTLVKSQAIVPCNSTADLSSSTYTQSALGKQADGTGTEVASGSCIAYKIEAKNNGNVALTNVIINDALENNALRKSYLYATPAPKICTPTSPLPACDTQLDPASVTNGNNGTVKTKPFNLPAQGTGTLYFKVQYNKV